MSEMSKFSFSYEVHPDSPQKYIQHITVEMTDEGLKMSCDSGDRECVHLVERANLQAFCEELMGFESDPMLAVILRAEGGRGADVMAAGHKHGRTLFVWP